MATPSPAAPPLPVALPAPPTGLNVHLPTAPEYPPTLNNVLEARNYYHDIEMSRGM